MTPANEQKDVIDRCVLTDKAGNRKDMERVRGKG
jgi:hypothetical protein